MVHFTEDIPLCRVIQNMLSSRRFYVELSNDHNRWMNQNNNINRLRNKLEELKLLIHDTQADIITIQETKLTPKAKTPKLHNFTAVRTDRLHKAGGGLVTLIRDNITFTTKDIPSTINTHNTELQMVKVHINH